MNIKLLICIDIIQSGNAILLIYNYRSYILSHVGWVSDNVTQHFQP